RSAESLTSGKVATIPAIERGVPLNIGECQVMIAIGAKVPKAPTALLREARKGNKGRAVPSHQDRFTHMIGVRQEALPGDFEGFPVVSPSALQSLKRLELLAVPGIDSR